MAIITFTSAAGSSGATTAWVGSALSWPSPVVAVEADPSGGSQVLAGYFRGLARPGLSELALAHRQGDLAEMLPSLLFPAADSQASFLPGIRTYKQAGAVAQVWLALLAALRELEADTGVDVLVDAGRLGLLGSPSPLLSDADVVVVVTGTGLPELAAVRGWLPSLEAAPLVGLVLVDPGRPYTASEIERDFGVPVFGVLPWEPSAARWWSHAEPCRRHDRTRLAKAVTDLGARLRELAPNVARAEVTS
ncbi:hypothetical protein [Propioniciclava tarda]|uniref:ParA family protein n=1 Tax=Propioniciclava tarda TaxID=433330 RepID=A0A4Q9KKS4_PROTD|nr:hypothetical protein [Propioniciclava tarda]TBT95097.1 hypothetical protein ET996_07510 [Propioniciclava tarda]SMO55908.1 hypothetical protein SAMN06266982_106111 [Propioniciclava tarda]